eukprot:c39565_g1_i2.p1 GENE.c39565_g1_i2~~c39565_g1_i2.p1  ORF type:complete len:755 (+),score=21.17 c39565_g1_i2:622-2886(+)
MHAVVCDAAIGARRIHVKRMAPRVDRSEKCGLHRDDRNVVVSRDLREFGVYALALVRVLLEDVRLQSRQRHGRIEIAPPGSAEPLGVEKKHDCRVVVHELPQHKFKDRGRVVERVDRCGLKDDQIVRRMHPSFGAHRKRFETAARGAEIAEPMPGMRPARLDQVHKAHPVSAHGVSVGEAVQVGDRAALVGGEIVLASGKVAHHGRPEDEDRDRQARIQTGEQRVKTIKRSGKLQRSHQPVDADGRVVASGLGAERAAVQGGAVGRRAWRKLECERWCGRLRGTLVPRLARRRRWQSLCVRGRRTWRLTQYKVFRISAAADLPIMVGGAAGGAADHDGKVGGRTDSEDLVLRQPPCAPSPDAQRLPSPPPSQPGHQCPAQPPAPALAFKLAPCPPPDSASLYSGAFGPEATGNYTPIGIDGLMRSLQFAGSLDRFHSLLARLDAGLPITVFILGSSVVSDFAGRQNDLPTDERCPIANLHGFSYRDPMGGYGMSFMDLVQARWPHARHRFCNLGAPSSSLEALTMCPERWMHSPYDLVIFEPATINSLDHTTAVFEFVLRQLVHDDAAVMLFLNTKWFCTARGSYLNATMPLSALQANILQEDAYKCEGIHAKLAQVAAYYDIPVISMQTAFFAPVYSGRHPLYMDAAGANRGITYDGVHPSPWGGRALSYMFFNVLATADARPFRSAQKFDRLALPLLDAATASVKTRGFVSVSAVSAAGSSMSLPWWARMSLPRAWRRQAGIGRRGLCTARM